MKNSFATVLNELSFLKLFQLANSDLLLSYHAYSIYTKCVNLDRLPKLGHTTLPTLWFANPCNFLYGYGSTILRRIRILSFLICKKNLLDPEKKNSKHKLAQRNFCMKNHEICFFSRKIPCG